MPPVGGSSETVPSGSPTALKNPYLFLVGCPRSGTTLLQRMLDNHPQLAVANDSHFIPRAPGPIGPGTRPPLTAELVERVLGYPRFRRLGLEESVARGAAARASTYEDFVSELYSEHARLHGKELAGEKTPDYVRYLPFLHALFPDARIIHIIRDGRDVALSMLEWARADKGPGKLALWLEAPVAVCALWWRWQVETGRRDGAQLPPGLYREVWYENLVLHPGETLRSLAVFLSLPFAHEMVSFHEGKTRPDPQLSAKEAWLPATPGLRDWRKEMPPRDLELFEAIAGDLLSELGYERKFDEIALGTAATARECEALWNAEMAARRERLERPLSGVANVNAVAHSAESTVDPRDVLTILRARGYLPDGEPFAVGRPDRTTIPLLTASGRPVVAKIYPDDGGEACFFNMRTLWSSSFGERRDPPGLPRPIEYLREHRVLVLERVAERALAEMGEPDAGAVQDAVWLAAALHASNARPTRRRSARGILRSLRRKAERISRHDSALGAKVQQVVNALEDSRREDRELVPCHGDFSPRNVLVGPDRSVLIDWDRFQLADPARDVACFGAWCWVERVRRGETPSWVVLERAVSTYEALRTEARLGERLGFHVAAALVRIADDLVLLCPEESRLVPLLAEEALRRLAEAG